MSTSDAHRVLADAAAHALPNALVEQLRRRGIPEPEREVMLVPGRRYRWDLVWEGVKVCVEVQGGTWHSGAHSRGPGQRRDAEKANGAIVAGYKPFSCTSDMIHDQTFADMLADVLTRLGVAGGQR